MERAEPGLTGQSGWPVDGGLIVWSCVAMLLLSGSLSAHSNSRSRSLLVIQPGHLSHFIKLQAQSVWEVLPLDADGNLLVEPDEFEAVKGQLARYVMDHVRLRPDGGAVLAGTLVRGELISDDGDALFSQQWIELELGYELTREPRELDIEVTLFLDKSPRHQDFCDVLWADDSDQLGADPVRLRFWAGDPRQLASSGRPLPPLPILTVLWDGARRLLSAPLALLCLGALLAGKAVESREQRRSAGLRVLILVFAGSLALGLACAVPLAGSLKPAAVSLAGALAVAWVGALNLVSWLPGSAARETVRPVWVEALVFGSLTGLGLGGGGASAVSQGAAAAGSAAPALADPSALTVFGAAGTALLLGWVLSLLLHNPTGAVARGLRLLLSVAAVLVGIWLAWSFPGAP